VADPVVSILVPSNVKAELVLSAEVDDANNTPLLVNAVNPVPPYDVPIVPASPDPRRLKPPTVLMFVPLTRAACLLLNVVQSADARAPLLADDAVGIFSVITGVVVPVATDDPTSVPDVPSVMAATDVTVPALIAVLNEVASSAEILLSAFTRMNDIADGLGIVKMFAPAVVPPNAVNAAPAVVAPVPP
jgi:hypothetical protein